jgi:hypothetical protein
MDQLAQAARVFADACDLPIVSRSNSLSPGTVESQHSHQLLWTNPRPEHEHAPRDDLIRSLTNFQLEFSGRVSHVLTADIANALFTDAKDQVDRLAVAGLVRAKKPSK